MDRYLMFILLLGAAFFLVLLINLIISKRKADQDIAQMKAKLKKLQTEKSNLLEQVQKKEIDLKKLTIEKQELLQFKKGVLHLLKQFLIEENTNAYSLGRHEQPSISDSIRLYNILYCDMLEKEEYQPVRSKIELNSYLNGMEQHFSNLVQKIDYSRWSDKVNIQTDAFLLDLIVKNLLLNSVENSGDKASIKIWITDARNELEIHVRDNGRGIPKKHQPSIFKKYFTLLPQKMSDSTAQGLGLYVCRLACELIAAKIEFDSKEKHGAHFILKAPKP
jgi:K+-sensing histidine kinase KdpD